MTPQKHSSHKQSIAGSVRSVARDPVEAMLAAVVVALIVARMLVPAESAATGDTLWVVQLWLAATLLWCWSCFRRNEFLVRVGRVDAALWLIIAGQIVSTAAVFVSGGDKRSALNMAWEWFGLGCSFFLIRQVVRVRSQQIAIICTLGAVAVAQSWLGLWQHYEWYPRMAADYQALQNEIDRLEDPTLSVQTPLTAAEREKLQQLYDDLSRQGVPMVGPGQELWRQRIITSREPFGMFALANTFAGLLVIWLLVVTGSWLSRKVDAESPVRWILVAIPILSLTYCLVLTKSRTAWVGLVVGGALAGVVALVRSGADWKRWGVIIAITVGLLGGMAAVASVSGGFDYAVIAEAPKSLSYRVEYWTGGWSVVQESPWLGCGPGNFRQHYLKHKLPGSSEEIGDPHNVVLDLWASGGLASVIGFCLLLIQACRLFFAAQPNQASRSNESAPQGRRDLNSAMIGAAMGFVAVFFFPLITGDPFDVRVVWLLVDSAIALFLLRGIRSDRGVPNLVLGGAFVAINVHLLGAGGISMPLVVQQLLILVALASVSRETESTGDRPYRRRLVGGMSVAAVVLFAGCLVTATLPVSRRNSALVLSRYMLSERNNIVAAENYLDAALAADSLSPTAYFRRADLEYLKWSRSAESTARDFEQVERMAREAMARDPDSWQPYATLGRWYLSAFQRFLDPAYALRAAEALEQAVVRYPNNSNLLATLAQAYSVSDQADRAQETAERAMRLDELNRERGHANLYFTPEIISQMDAILRKSDDEVLIDPN